MSRCCFQTRIETGRIPRTLRWCRLGGLLTVALCLSACPLGPITIYPVFMPGPGDYPFTFGDVEDTELGEALEEFDEPSDPTGIYPIRRRDISAAVRTYEFATKNGERATFTAEFRASKLNAFAYVGMLESDAYVSGEAPELELGSSQAVVVESLDSPHGKARCPTFLSGVSKMCRDEEVEEIWFWHARRGSRFTRLSVGFNNRHAAFVRLNGGVDYSAMARALNGSL